MIPPPAGLIERKLKHHQFDSAKWQSPIHKMIEQVMQVELAPGFRLGLLTRADRMEEMEFLFLPVHSRSLILSPLYQLIQCSASI